MSDNQTTMPVNAWLDLNDPIFTQLEEKINLLLDKKDDNLDRKLQLRTVLYLNFNNYLTLLLAKNEDKINDNTIEELINSPADNRLEQIAFAARSSVQKIIDDFLMLFSEKN